MVPWPGARTSSTTANVKGSTTRATGAPAVFWLDANRAHDAQLITKVKQSLGDHDTQGLQIEILSPVEATRFSLSRIRKGQDAISVTLQNRRCKRYTAAPRLPVNPSRCNAVSGATR